MQDTGWADKDLVWERFVDMIDQRQVPGEVQRARDADVHFEQAYHPTSPSASSPYPTWIESEESQTDSDEY